MAVKSNKKRGSKAQKSPLMLFLLIIILLAILSVVVAYFILQDDTKNEAVPAQTTTETQQEEEPTLTVEPMYTGTWVSNYDGVILTLNRFSFTLEMPSVDQKTAIKGELSVVKNVLTFVNTSGAETCQGDEGHYQYSLEDNGDIFFKLIKDNCKSRKARMEMSWFRL
ncbi:MAG: hypothetical protein DRI89_01425 [Bacteroidetes bacterium]|nr:MAG: hypothetical protein DRI89_01425 [Bacteroidota bacterium]